jgi:hypothetical protein
MARLHGITANGGRWTRRNFLKSRRLREATSLMVAMMTCLSRLRMRGCEERPQPEWGTRKKKPH